MHARASVLVALPLPRHRESAAADLAASHTGLGIPVLVIEGVRAHASAISTGALAVFSCVPTPAGGAGSLGACGGRRPPATGIIRLQ